MLFRLLTIGFILTLTTLITLINLGTEVGHMLSTIVHEIPGGDKMAHFLLFGILTVLLNYTFSARQIRIGMKTFLLGSVVVAITITLEECSQAFLPTRHFEIMDMVCNYAGILTGSRFFLWRNAIN